MQPRNLTLEMGQISTKECLDQYHPSFTFYGKEDRTVNLYGKFVVLFMLLRSFFMVFIS